MSAENPGPKGVKIMDLTLVFYGTGFCILHLVRFCFEKVYESWHNKKEM